MKSVRRFETHSDEETRDVGRILAALLPPQAVVLLTGDLGAGKTTLSQGIVEGRGAARAHEVSSPTYTLIHEYGEPISIYHVDLYRIEREEEVLRLGLPDLFDEPALVLIEWGERFPQLWPANRFKVRIDYLDADSRLIELISG